MNFYNRVKFTTSTTGTGTITVGTASTGFRTPAQAGIPTGTTIRYSIDDGSDWEYGYGTYTSSGTTLSRNVMGSSNSNALLSLTGNAVVKIPALAEELPSWINVKQYGAKGDGVTNDTTAITNAITDLNVSGGVLYFPQGQYLTS